MLIPRGDRESARRHLRWRPGSDTGERVSPSENDTAEARLMYLRHLFAYEVVLDHLTGTQQVLDVGCGTGYGTSILAERSSFATGVDIDSSVIQKADQQHGSERCRFQEYEGVRLPFDDHSFDVVAAMQVLEHVPGDRAFLHELQRVLTDDGTAFLTTPNRDHRLTPGQKPWNRFHVREYSTEGLTSILESAFSDVHIVGVRFAEPAKSVELARVRRLRRLARLDPLGLRRFLPDRVVHLAGKGTRDQGLGLFAGAKTHDLFSLDDIFPSEGLDLLAIVRR